MRNLYWDIRGTTPDHDDYNDLLEAEKNCQLELGAAATQYVEDTLKRQGRIRAFRGF